jgi:hypothetical protein
MSTSVSSCDEFLIGDVVIVAKNSEKPMSPFYDPAFIYRESLVGKQFTVADFNGKSNTLLKIGGWFKNNDEVTSHMIYFYANELQLVQRGVSTLPAIGDRVQVMGHESFQTVKRYTVKVTFDGPDGVEQEATMLKIATVDDEIKLLEKKRDTLIAKVETVVDDLNEINEKIARLVAK